MMKIDKDSLIIFLKGFGVAAAMAAIILVALNLNDFVVMCQAVYETPRINRIAKSLGKLSTTNNTTQAIFWAKKHAKEFNVDYKLVLAIVIQESHLNRKARGINKNGTIDYGLGQINTCWRDVLMSDTVLYTMTDGNTNDINKIEDFIFNIEHNLWATCFVLKEKMAYNGQSLIRGVRGYNGYGYKAEQYADTVLRIFGLIAKEY